MKNAKKVIIDIINSGWFRAAAVGAAGALVLMYGYKLYAGLILGWACNDAWKWLKSMKF